MGNCEDSEGEVVVLLSSGDEADGDNLVDGQPLRGGGGAAQGGSAQEGCRAAGLWAAQMGSEQFRGGESTVQKFDNKVVPLPP